MNPTILRADAASAERENWKPLLKNQNYDLVATDNTKSARRMWLRLQPDLGLFDNHLAQVRGANSSRRLKQDLLNQHRWCWFLQIRLWRNWSKDAMRAQRISRARQAL